MNRTVWLLLAVGLLAPAVGCRYAGSAGGLADFAPELGCLERGGVSGDPADVGAAPPP